MGQLIVHAVRRLLEDKVEAACVHPLRAITCLLVFLSVFAYLNRQQLAAYNASFWRQLFYLLCLVQVVFTLFQLIVDQEFRQRLTIACLLRNHWLGKWLKHADRCVVQVFCLTSCCLIAAFYFAVEALVSSILRSLWRSPRRTVNDLGCAPCDTPAAQPGNGPSGGAPDFKKTRSGKQY